MHGKSPDAKKKTQILHPGSPLLPQCRESAKFARRKITAGLFCLSLLRLPTILDFGTRRRLKIAHSCSKLRTKIPVDPEAGVSKEIPNVVFSFFFLPRYTEKRTQNYGGVGMPGAQQVLFGNLRERRSLRNNERKNK